MSESFTYIDDVMEIMIKLINKPATPDKFFNTNKPNTSTSWCSNRILNIGNYKSTKLIDFISCLEKELGIEAKKNFFPIQHGDVVNTLSDNKLIFGMDR